MPYDIELMSIGRDIYPLLERSAASLNGVQSEFRFHLTPPTQRQPGIALKRERYVTSEIWTFLQDHRVRFGGNRPYIIAFATGPLESAKLANIFGSHEASEGLAVVTTNDSGHYVKEESRYCCYYLVRYSLSFINPLIKAHDDEDRKDCYFHRKLHKPDIRVSMDHGHICDQCMQQLDAPPPESGARRLSDDEREALRRMLQFVSGDLPHAIVMKGGGVKGLAFAGALLELENHYWFDRHVGTSAGAIAAVLLAAKYTPAELRDLLLQKDFRDFLDAPAWMNLLLRHGCYPGEQFRLWIAGLLVKKMPRILNILMADLHDALVYATQRGAGTIRFDSTGERSETAAAFAVRCSMSIPFFFFPTLVDGERVFDGGLRNNFPLKTFLADHPRSNFIGLYLRKPDNSLKRSLRSELIDIVVEGDERKIVDENIRNIVVIDTSPVGTVDFSLTPLEKEFLLRAGKSAALRFLFDRNLDDGPNLQEVSHAEAEAEASRKAVRQARALRRVVRSFWFLCLVLIVAGVLLLFF